VRGTEVAQSLPGAVTPISAAGAVVRVVRVVRASSKLTFAVALVGLSLISTAWALSTPLAASPDEPAHIIKAASVVRGELVGSPTAIPGTRRVMVPKGLSEAGSWTCFAFQPQVSADCIGKVSNGDSLRPATTSAGLYNPLYYSLVGLPSLTNFSTPTVVFLMRIFSGIITSAFLAVSFVLLRKSMGGVLSGVVFFVAVTPMVLFLSGSVNPNSLEVGAAIALVSGLLLLVSAAENSRKLPVLVVIGVSGVVLANTRGVSPLWIAEIAIGVLIYTPWRTLVDLLRWKSVRATLAVLILGVAVGSTWTLSTGSLNSMGTFTGAGTTSPLRGFYEMLVNRTFDSGVVGVFGWLDTPVPNFVYFLWGGLIFGIFLLALSFGRGRRRLAFVFALAALLLSPPIVQALSVEHSGYIWQGRYTLAIYAAAVVFAGAAAARQSLHARPTPPPVRTLVVVLSGLIFLAQGASFAAAINRYSGHATQSVLGFLDDPQWSPPGGALLWIAVFAAGLLLLITLWVSSAAEDEMARSLRRVSERKVDAPTR